MNALTWSTTIAALMFGGSVFAADKPSPSPNVVWIEADGAAVKPALIKLVEPPQGKSGEANHDRFYIEIIDKKVDKDADQAKQESLPGKAGESAERPRRLFVCTNEAAEADRNWIGLSARPLTNEERSKLNVQGEWGLAIEEIIPNSPAATAGLKPHDVLWKAGTTGLKKLTDLADVVRNAKGRNIAIEYQRDGGKRQTIAVKTAKRPDGEFEGRQPAPEACTVQVPVDAATIANLASELASRQSLKTLLVDVAAAEARAPADAKTGDQIKTLLAQRRELQARARELNEKLKAVSAGRETSALAEPLQAQLRIASKEIEAINRQTVAVELSRGAPDRDALRRQLSTLRHCASELTEVGRTEEASHLMSKAHDLEAQLEASAQAQPEPIRATATLTADPNTLRLWELWKLKQPETANPTSIRVWGSKQPDADQIRLSQIKSAMQLLAEAGLREDAEHLAQKVEALEREQKMQQRRDSLAKLALEPTSDPSITELRNQIEQMHRELQEIKDAVSRLSEQKK